MRRAVSDGSAFPHTATAGGQSFDDDPSSKGHKHGGCGRRLASLQMRIRAAGWKGKGVAVLFVLLGATSLFGLMLFVLSPPNPGQPTGTSVESSTNSISGASSSGVQGDRRYVQIRQVAGKQKGHGDPIQPGEESQLALESHAGNDCNMATITEAGEIVFGVDGVQELVHNTSISGSVQEDEYAFYQVCVAKHGHEHQLKIEVKALTGDPDLYCSTTIVRPTLAHCTWISASLGSDDITLTSEHPDWDPESSTMFIGVYGRTPATFTVDVTIEVVPPPPVLGLRGRSPNSK